MKERKKSESKERRGEMRLLESERKKSEANDRTSRNTSVARKRAVLQS
jgi:hypothetical protein